MKVRVVTVPIFNVSRRKVGGIWFVKLGRINLSFSVSRPNSMRMALPWR